MSRIVEAKLTARTPEQCHKSYLNAKRLRKTRNMLIETYVPSDLYDENDVAFGVTKSGRYLDATMLDVSDVGSVSHGTLLYAAVD